MFLRQPNLETLAFEEAGQVGVETLFGQREQRTGQIDFGHGVLLRRHTRA
jgi:hypothetical protein